MEKEAKSRTHWTEEEITFLKKNWTLPMAELSEKLGRSIDSCLQKAYSLGMYRRKWTQAEIDYLQENYGKYSIPSLAKSLGKSVNAIKVMRQRLGLGAFLMNGEYISLNQLLLAVNGGASTYSYKMTSWVKNRGLPVHTKKVENCSLRVTAVRAERIQDIIADQCAMEGVWPLYAGPIGGRESYYKTAFAKLWDSTIKKEDLPDYGWDANPWVWVIKFEKISKEEATKC